MARYDHLPIFKTSYGLCLLIYRITKNFTREYKFTLGERIKNSSHDILDLVVETNSVNNEAKAAILRELSLKVEQLRMQLRLSIDLKLITSESLGKAAEIMEELTKQVSGWEKWATEKR